MQRLDGPVRLELPTLELVLVADVEQQQLLAAVETRQELAQLEGGGHRQMKSVTRERTASAM